MVWESTSTKLTDETINIKPKWNIHDDKTNKTLTTYHEESLPHEEPETLELPRQKLVLRTSNVVHIKKITGVRREQVHVHNIHLPSKIGAYILIWYAISWFAWMILERFSFGEAIYAFLMLCNTFIFVMSLQRDYAAWKPVKESLEIRYNPDPEAEISENYNLFTGYYMHFRPKKYGVFDQRTLESVDVPNLPYAKLPESHTPSEPNKNERILQIERIEHVDNHIKNESLIYYTEKSNGFLLAVVYLSLVFILRLFVIAAFIMIGLPMGSIYTFDFLWISFGVYTLWKYTVWLAFKKELLTAWKTDKAIKKHSVWDPVTKWTTQNK